jgi:OHCU decarboxylase
MRANPADYEMVALGNLQAIVSLLARERGQWLPIAGGTDVMVQYEAGQLAARKLVSIWNLPELRRIDVSERQICIGAGCTYSDLRKQEIVRTEFPLLYRAASWTGGIANQNRGTIGGNIVNASPAADSLPALLVYDAELILVSVRGERRLPYKEFHTGYKKMQLEPDELIQSVCLPRQFAEYFSYARKVGARNSQAISKVCIAAAGKLSGGVVEDIRIALGSVAPVPLRLKETEHLLKGRVIDSDLLVLARKTMAAQIRPIDDIRSTARYRGMVAGNLVVEFLSGLSSEHGHGRGDGVLTRWNGLSEDDALQEILPCCGSSSWARAMVERRPMADENALLIASNVIWSGLSREDWMEAFRSHPRIGESRSASPSSPSVPGARSVEWSAQEQRNVADALAVDKIALAEANREYERRFGRIFIVCATGKPASEILRILRRRLGNEPETELREAAEEQRQIMQVRLKKWLRG